MPAAMRSFGWSVALVPLSLVVAPMAGAAESTTPQSTSSLPPPMELTAPQDHQRIMDLLHITSLRRWAAIGADLNAHKMAQHGDTEGMRLGPMTTVAIPDAQANLPEIVENLKLGAEVILTRNEQSDQIKPGTTGHARLHSHQS